VSMNLNAIDEHILDSN